MHLGGVSLYGAVGQGYLARPVNLFDTSFSDQFLHIFGRYTTTSQYLDIRSTYQSSYNLGTLQRCGSLTGGEQTMTTTVGDDLQSLERILSCLVEGPMESNFHGCRQLHHATRKLFLNTSIFRQKTNNHGSNSQFLASLDSELHLCQLGKRITEVTRPRSN